jgi:hypothetical protein
MTNNSCSHAITLQRIFGGCYTRTGASESTDCPLALGRIGLEAAIRNFGESVSRPGEYTDRCRRNDNMMRNTHH